jgi:hypothetical protein
MDAKFAKISPFQVDPDKIPDTLSLTDEDFRPAGESEKDRQNQRDLQLLNQAWQSGENKLNREQQEALQRLSQEFSAGESAKDRELQKTLQELSQAFQSRENALNRTQSQSQFDIEMAFKEKQLTATQDQWKQEFDYNKMSDAQKLAYNYVVNAASNGGDVSDALLEKAGLSREDYNAMKADVDAVNSGSSSSRSSGSSSSDTGSTDTRPEWQKKGFKSKADYDEGGYKFIDAESYYKWKEKQNIDGTSSDGATAQTAQTAIPYSDVKKKTTSSSTPPISGVAATISTAKTTTNTTGKKDTVNKGTGEALSASIEKRKQELKDQISALGKKLSTAGITNSERAKINKEIEELQKKLNKYK